MCNWKILLALVSAFLMNSSALSHGLVVDEELKSLFLDDYLQTWSPGGHQPSLEGAMKWPGSKMQSLQGKSLYTPYFGASIWGKCTFQTSSNFSQRLYLLIQRTFHIELDVYLQKGKEPPQRLKKEPLRAGNSIPYFQLKLVPGQDYTVYIHIDNHGSIGAHPVLLLNQEELLFSLQTRQFYNGAFYGVILLILLFTGYYYLRFRWRPLLYYILYLVCTTAMVFSWEGYAFALLFPLTPSLNPILLSLSVNLGMFFGVRFFIEFLHPEMHSPWLQKAAKWVSYLFLAALPFAMFPATNHYLIFLNNFLALFGILFLVGGTVLLIPLQKRPAWSYLVAVVLLGLGVVAQVVENAGVPSRRFDSLSSLELGFVLEFVVLAGTLLYEWRKRLETEQQKALDALEKLHESKGLLLANRMKPHFLFNSLASIQNFVLVNQKEDAIGYISQFSRLVRKTLDLSKKPVINLAEELEMVELYASLEKVRTEGDFELERRGEGRLKSNPIKVPNMLLQPFIENSIWHGLRGLDRPGRIVIELREEQGWLHLAIEDNGRGRQAAQRSQNPKHQSAGLEITRERICLHNGWETDREAVNIIDQYEDGAASGTRVELQLRINSEK